jgi:hypothetical protein
MNGYAGRILTGAPSTGSSHTDTFAEQVVHLDLGGTGMSEVVETMGRKR